MNELAKKYEQMLNKSLPPHLFGQFSISPGPHLYEDGGSDMNTRIAAVVINPYSKQGKGSFSLLSPKQLLDDPEALTRECDAVLNAAINGEKP